MKKRKQLRVLVIVLAAGSLTAFLFFQVLRLIQHGENIRRLEPGLLAAFHPVGEAGLATTGEKPTLLVHFMPDCSFCQYEAKTLSLHREVFEQVRLILVSRASPQAIEAFAREYGFWNRPGILLLHDGEGRFADRFGTRAVPAIFIYDKDGRLLKQYRGETKIEAILNHLNPVRHEAISQETQ